MVEVNEEDFLNDLYLFYRYFIASHYKNSVPAPHIKKLANKLMKLALHGDDKHRLAVSMPPRHILADSTKVYTFNKGWITHGELTIGDKVIGLNGEPTEVIGLSSRKLCDNRILFSNGRTLLSHDGHLWGVYEDDNEDLIVLSTEEIREGLLNGNQYSLPKPDYDVEYDELSILNIIKVEDKEYGHCIEIDNDDGLYLVDDTFIPTHNSKSSMVTLAFPLWLLFQDPNVNIMIVTGSPKLAEKFGIQLREYVRELGHYFNVYLSNVKQASTHIMFCDKHGKLYRGNIMLATSGGGITGQDADYLILDDPYTGQDSEFTPSALQQKIDWVNRVVEQRIEPHTKYCVLHTRWNSGDIIGYYKENEPELYEFVEFPAINPDGTVLWKERYTLDEMLKKKEIVGPRVFESVYQQKPIDTTSDFFNINNLKFGVPENYVSQQCVRAWDIAASDATTHNDFTAGVRAHRFDDYFIIDDLVHGRFGGQVNQIIKSTAMSDTPNVKIYIETGVGNANLLFAEWKNQLKGYIVEQAKVSGRGSKADRATPFKNALEDGKVFINISDDILRDSLIKEMKGFPFLPHDDIVDSIAHSYNALFMSDSLGKKVNARIEAIDLNW